MFCHSKIKWRLPEQANQSVMSFQNTDRLHLQARMGQKCYCNIATLTMGACEWEVGRGDGQGSLEHHRHQLVDDLPLQAVWGANWPYLPFSRPGHHPLHSSYYLSTLQIPGMPSHLNII